MSTEADEVELLKTKLDDAIQANLAAEQELMQRYQVAPQTQVMVLVRLEELANAVLGRDSVERLEYELSFQTRLADILRQIKDEVKKKPDQKLIIPKAQVPSDLRA